MVSVMSKLVYLDSSDFSNLSIPYAELNREHQTILTALRESKRAGTATFFMSAVHLSEAIHASDAHKEAAVRRAALMRELCGSNILRLPTDLPALEIGKALRGEKNISLSVGEIRSAPGEWFGAHVPLDGMSTNRENIRKKLQGALNALPRRERRKQRSELSFRKRSSHEKWRAILESGARSLSVPYPLNLLEHSILIGWLLGEVSNSEFRHQTLKITHDPYVMFKYLIDEKEQRQRLYDSLRKQGRDLADQIEESARQIIDALVSFANSEITPDIGSAVGNFFSRPHTLRLIMSSYGAFEHLPNDGLQAIVRSCPSLSTITEIYKSIFASRAYAYFRRVRAGNTNVKQPNPSDFGDLMHCHYAPYFDIFRCDASFGAHLKAHKPVRAKIADRISDLLAMLSEQA